MEAKSELTSKADINTKTFIKKVQKYPEIYGKFNLLVVYHQYVTCLVRNIKCLLLQIQPILDLSTQPTRMGLGSD